MEERLQKYLANCGIASRRKCEEYILEGKVEVNGNIVNELGIKINPEKDVIKFENKIVKQANKMIYILLLHLFLLFNKKCYNYYYEVIY